MEIREAQLHPGTIFHVFNRGINGAPIFFEEKNYHYFLQQYGRYVHPFVETFAYCLLGNHFHILVRVRSEQELQSVISKNKEKDHYWHVSKAFGSLFQGYTRAMNNMYNRTGALLETPFKRIPVTDEAYFSQLVAYIHQNPTKHGLMKDYRDYPYSSYHTHLAKSKKTKLKREEVLDWFGGSKEYIDFHNSLEERLLLDESYLLE